MIYDKLINILDDFHWDRDANGGRHDKELRIAGNSLGGQFALKLSAKIIKDSVDYRSNLKRIALLDHFYSRWNQGLSGEFGWTAQV